MSHAASSQTTTQIDDPVAGATWVVSLSSIIILVALVIATCVFYFRFETIEVDTKVVEAPDAWKLALKAQQLGQLSVYQKYTVTSHSGSEEQRLRIPIARAMELLVAESAVPVATQSPSAGASTP